MGRNTYIRISGAEQITKALLEMEKKVARKTVRVAGKKGAEIIKAAAIEEAPVDSGDLIASIKIKTRIRKGVFTANVQVGEGAFKGDTFYAGFIQYGAPGRNLEPNPFMDRAFDRKKEEAARVMEKELLKGIEAEVKKST